MHNLPKMHHDLKRQVEDMLERRDPGHDFQHVMRVYKNAQKIGKAEGADMRVLLAAVLLHDLVVYPKGSAKRSKSSDDSADIAEKILLRRGWPKATIDRVSYCIRTHSYSKGIKPMTLEAKILQDADRLDALGAIGIARTFSVGGSENRKFYNPKDPFWKSQRELNDRIWTLDHFQTKLLNLHKTLHTKTARKMATKRSEFMRNFVRQLAKEV